MGDSILGLGSCTVHTRESQLSLVIPPPHPHCACNVTTASSSCLSRPEDCVLRLWAQRYPSFRKPLTAKCLVTVIRRVADICDNFGDNKEKTEGVLVDSVWHCGGGHTVKSLETAHDQSRSQWKLGLAGSNALMKVHQFWQPDHFGRRMERVGEGEYKSCGRGKSRQSL